DRRGTQGLPHRSARRSAGGKADPTGAGISRPMKPGVIFDCVVCLQGAAREAGPAGACFRLMRDGQVTVYVSHSTLVEVADVLNRPKLRLRFKTLTGERVEAFLRELKEVAMVVDPVPQAFTYPRDP